MNGLSARLLKNSQLLVRASTVHLGLLVALVELAKLMAAEKIRRNVIAKC